MQIMLQQLKTNSLLQGGRYRIEQTLGQGSFGITYRGYDTERGERIAIKEFFMKGVTERDDYDLSVSVSNISNYRVFQEQKEKFRKEAQRLRQLQNLHIVCVHDQFEENGTAYYVMDYVDGENLHERMKRTGSPLTEDEVWNMLPQVLSALKTVHDAGLWHLDLKPGNIMVDNTGNVKLIDFGASKQIDAQKGGATSHTAICYTVGYAPQEQIDKKYNQFGPWTDIYALGATLYALLTNQRPPLPSDIEDDSTSDKSNVFAMLSTVSKKMRDLIVWMMNTSRRKRPQSVSEIMDFLGGNISDEETEFSQSATRQEETVFTNQYQNEETEFSQAYDNYSSSQQPQGQRREKLHSQMEVGDNSYSNEDDTAKVTIIIFFVIIFIVIFAFVIYQINLDKYSTSSSSKDTPATTTITEPSTTYGTKDVWYDSMGSGTYEGGLKNGEMNGHGTITYTSGQRFTGEFMNGITNGHGVLYDSDGTVLFDGEYINGERTRGTQTFANGNVFTGKFQYGRMHDGTLKSANGEILGKGEFSFDGRIYNGYGKESGTSSDGISWTYEGKYEDGLWNDQNGTMTLNDSRQGYMTKYKGGFVNGKRSGYGVADYNENRYEYILRYEGYWKDNLWNGTGTAYYIGGIWRQGTWKDGALMETTKTGEWEYK